MITPYPNPGMAGDTPVAPPVEDPNQQMLMLLQAMAAKQAEAQSGADQAGQQYQEAAAAPNPGLNPLAALTGGLLPDLASIISGNEKYSQRGHQQVKQAQADLMQKRSDNLKALADAYEQKSKAAKEIGNKAMELEFEEKKGKIQKQHETVLKTLAEQGLNAREAAGNQSAKDIAGNNRTSIEGEGDKNRANEIELQKLRNAGSLANTNVRAGVVGGSSSDAGISDAELESLENGTSTLKDYRQARRPAVIQALAARGSKLIPQKARDVVAATGSARSVIEKLKELSATLNTAEGGVDRFRKGLANKGGAISQGNPDAALFETKQGELSLIARSMGEKGNMSNQDIARAKKLLPTLFDSQEVATRKLDDLSTLYDQIESRTITAYTTKLGGGNTVKMTAPDGRLLEVPNDPEEIKRMTALGAKRR